MNNRQCSTSPSFDQDRLTREEAARYLGVSPTTLIIDARQQHLNVPFYRVGKRCYYRRSELDAWLESHRVLGGAA